MSPIQELEALLMWVEATWVETAVTLTEIVTLYRQVVERVVLLATETIAMINNRIQEEKMVDRAFLLWLCSLVKSVCPSRVGGNSAGGEPKFVNNVFFNTTNIERSSSVGAFEIAVKTSSTYNTTANAFSHNVVYLWNATTRALLYSARDEWRADALERVQRPARAEAPRDRARGEAEAHPEALADGPEHLREDGERRVAPERKGHRDDRESDEEAALGQVPEQR